MFVAHFRIIVQCGGTQLEDTYTVCETVIAGYKESEYFTTTVSLSAKQILSWSGTLIY
jgi:hypothetical protein